MDLPNLEGILAGDTSVPTRPADPPIHMAYFSKAGCAVCARVNTYLDTVQRLYHQLIITEFPIEEEDSKALSEWLGQRYGVPEEKRLSTPMVFVGEDYKARRGEHQAMTLRIPLQLRRRMNRVIREGAQARAFVPVAFTTGFVVSIIELACTGQVYLPTIIFVMGVPEMQGKAFLYLLLYNLAFILPLVVVFGLAYFGTTSEQLGVFINRRTATIKLGTALLFLVLAGWLFITLL